MSWKKKSFLMLSSLVLILTLLLPGCITVTYETKINSDGSGQSIQDRAIDESFASMLESSEALQGNKGIEDALKKNMPKDAKYKKFTKDGKVHHQITFDFQDVDELNKTNKKLKKISNVPIAVEAKLEKADFVVFANYKYTNEFSSGSKGDMKPEEEQVAKASSITYKLTLPGTITKAENTDEVDGSTATWHINPTQGRKIEATSRYIRWWLIIVLLVAILLIIIISGILIFLGLRKKKPAPSEPTKASEEQQTKQQT